ncbi:cell wall protein IFF6-like [Lycium ferocissimum]|uniref:cell wall protein IFF6-like n=1 Tax=Lycium ferocissimum TaxID=112874 RepID=UPI002816413D|nr:cell wall protein IFF6-like [Lycium ferocissimum]
MAAPQVDNEYWDEIAKARVELQNLISKENYNAWDLLRLAYASQFSIANFHHAYAGTSTSTDATTKKTQSAINNLKTKMGNSTSIDATTKNTQSVNNNLKTEIGTSTSTDATTKNTQSANNNLKTEIGTSTSTDATTKNTQSVNNNLKTEIGTSTSTDTRTMNTQSANNNLKTEIGTSTSTDATTKNTQSAINNLKTEIESIKRNHHVEITYPDLYQLAGVVALHTLGGPVIEFVPGREDSTISPDEGCLPDVSVKG